MKSLFLSGVLLALALSCYSQTQSDTILIDTPQLTYQIRPVRDTGYFLFQYMTDSVGPNLLLIKDNRELHDKLSAAQEVLKYLPLNYSPYNLGTKERKRYLKAVHNYRRVLLNYRKK